MVIPQSRTENFPHMHRPGEQRLYLPKAGSRLRYLLYLPPAFDSLRDRRWPVLCFLHGRGEAATTPDGTQQSAELLFNHGAPPWHCATDSPLVREFIVVSPQLPTQGPWQRTDFDEVVEVLEFVCRELRGDSERISLTGFSLGGRGVFDFAGWTHAESLRHQMARFRWAALWPVDDASELPRTSCDVERIWLHFGIWHPETHRSTVEQLALQEAAPYRSGSATEARLYTDYTAFGYGHCPTCVAAYADARVYQWLLQR